MLVSPPITDRPSRCGYLPDRDWRLEYRIAHELSADEYAEWMLQGWRHFGRTLFRPRCQGCDACRPIRVDVDRFRPDRSQRRARKANEADLRLEIADPVAGPEQLDLYRRYHAHQAAGQAVALAAGRGRDEYRESFVDNPFPTREWRYYLGETLVGVGYVDPLPVGPSAITFIHDPSHRDRSLGHLERPGPDRPRPAPGPAPRLPRLLTSPNAPRWPTRPGSRRNQTLGPDGRWRDFRTREPLTTSASGSIPPLTDQTGFQLLSLTHPGSSSPTDSCSTILSPLEDIRLGMPASP